MSRTIRSFLVPWALSAGLAVVGCKKQQDDAAPPAAAASPRESRVDPRLDPRLAQGGEAEDGGAAADPRGGNPHAGMGGAGDMGASPHGGGGGRTPEKTADGRVVLGPVTAAVPKSWKDKPTTSGMRVAQWAIPGKAGDAELVVYYFGEGGAGSAQQNLDRWIQQFEQPDGSASAEK